MFTRIFHICRFMRGNSVMSLLFISLIQREDQCTNGVWIKNTSAKRERERTVDIRSIKKRADCPCKQVHFKFLIICENNYVFIIDRDFQLGLKSITLHIYTEVKQQKNIFKYLQGVVRDFELGTAEQGTAIGSHRSKTNKNITRGWVRCSKSHSGLDRNRTAAGLKRLRPFRLGTWKVEARSYFNILKFVRTWHIALNVNLYMCYIGKREAMVTIRRTALRTSHRISYVLRFVKNLMHQV